MKVLLVALLLVLCAAKPVSPPPAKLQNSAGDFLVGIFKGFQVDPSFESYCVLELKNVVSNFSLLMHNIAEIFSNYVFIFQSLTQFAGFMDELDTSLKSCEFSRLIEQIEALREFSGRSAVLARIAIKSNFLIQAWKTFYYSLFQGAAEDMGIAVGNILSVVLNFNI